MQASENQPFPWRLILCELCGTAVFVLVGLSLVIGLFGAGSPMTQLIPNEGLRKLIAGFLFDSDRDGLFRRMSKAECPGETLQGSRSS